MEYDYTTCPESGSQYENEDLSKQTVVSAKYVKAELPNDEGNPYIEALPHMRSEKSMMYAYSAGLPGYSFDKVKSMKKYEKLLQIGTLRNLRFPLPFQSGLELHFHNALLTSYRARKQMLSNGTPIPFMLNNTEHESDSILAGSSSDSTNAGFSLIGYSGCGKSSAVSILVSYYPQVIIHNDGDGGYFPQITYLVVNCVANSNFNALYQSVGEAIDKALGNVVPVYEKEIAQAKGLGKKGEKVRTLIERFAIGVLIFDEIQLLDFSHTKENSFDALLNLTNRTKVALAVIGTEDAKRKMFPELRTARRIGNVIDGNQYCKNKQVFAFLVNQLFHYQWFDTPVTVTQEICDALFEATKGIVDQLITIYTWMNIDYLQTNPRPVVDGSYVKQIAKTYCSGVREPLIRLAIDEKKDRQLLDSLDSKAKLDAILDNARQEASATKLIAMGTAIQSSKAQLDDVTANIQGIFDYTNSQIAAAYHKVVAKKGNAEKNARELSQLVIAQIQKEPTRHSRKNKLAPPDDAFMRDFIGAGDNNNE